ncbi:MULTISPECIES: fimbrial biogenesis chaperone [unclassified Pseudomonas]|jgi:chaperone protein EcpD|uniref:fimbrial biogenesis chaperone n=1 Tax=unclassified Pseudomonas TaxID=196821 RepID=UPI002168D47D|nr:MULTISPECIES: molecular chaperone [unclassified Pseudomonas]MCS3419783.1 chaperone protein EcpD [Pseudomonas sp. BIGb0558]MCS3439577.1 chaperone protein EcpD [Pseudomonas sp. BIGb0450]
MFNLSTTCSRLLMRVVLGFSLSQATQLASAGVIINGTRQVYPEQRREITIQLTNDDQHTPRLVQAWVDGGDAHQARELNEAPFSLSPPVFRLDAGKSQAMRLAYNKAPLPADRESLFWLNVLEVPPRINEFDPVTEEGDRNHLQFAFRIRTKVFFRPTGLPGNADTAPGQLRFALQRSAKGVLLQVHNPSAYHVTFNEIALAMGAGPGARVLPVDAQMVEPGGTLSLPVREAVAVIPPSAQVHFKYINDYGAFSPTQRAALQF